MSDADEFAGGLDDLERWAAEARAREAADARVRERWLRIQAEEDARLAQVLAGLAERGTAVIVTTAAGRQVAGRLTAIGRDFVAVASPAGHSTLISLHALAWVRTAHGDGARRRREREPAVGPDPSPFDVGERSVGASGDGSGGNPAGAALVDVLAQAVAGRPRVVIQTENASLLGALRSVGVDVVVVQTATDPPGLAYVRLRSIYEISFLDSG